MATYRRPFGLLKILIIVVLISNIKVLQASEDVTILSLYDCVSREIPSSESLGVHYYGDALPGPCVFQVYTPDTDDNICIRIEEFQSQSCPMQLIFYSNSIEIPDGEYRCEGEETVWCSDYNDVTVEIYPDDYNTNTDVTLSLVISANPPSNTEYTDDEENTLTVVDIVLIAFALTITFVVVSWFIGMCIMRKLCRRPAQTSPVSPSMTVYNQTGVSSTNTDHITQKSSIGTRIVDQSTFSPSPRQTSQTQRLQNYGIRETRFSNYSHPTDLGTFRPTDGRVVIPPLGSQQGPSNQPPSYSQAMGFAASSRVHPIDDVPPPPPYIY